MKLNRMLVSSIALILLSVSVFAQEIKPGAAIRNPLGVYVHIDIDLAINQFPGPAPAPPEQLHAFLRNLYASLLADPAISGIALGAHWDKIQLSNAVDALGNPIGYDWSYVDDAFVEADAVNKSIQLIVTPGFDSPNWLLDGIDSCDGLFTKGGTVPDDCGKVSFTGFPEEERADGTVLPLPWNTAYQEAWKDFLKNLNTRYKSDPAFVSISVAGPVGASDEIILPTTQNDKTPQLGGLPADKVWAMLIEHSFPSNPAYQNSDQVFIDQWNQTMGVYEQIFSGVTLVINPDTGTDLPKLAKKVKPHSDNTLFDEDCSTSSFETSCEAKTEILSNFVSISGSNGKSSQVGGMTASSSLATGNIGIPGVKVLTSLAPPPSPPFVGGSQFDKSVSSSTTLQQEGCPTYPSLCKHLTVEQGAANVLKVFFDGTPAAGDWGGTVGSAPIEYLQIPFDDVQYAQANPCPAKPSKIIGNTSLQDLLNRASHDLFEMAGQPSSLPPPTCTAGTITGTGSNGPF